MLFVNNHSIWSTIMFEDKSVLKQCKDIMTGWEKKKGTKKSGWKPTWEPLRFYREDSPYMLSVPTALLYKLDGVQFESRVEDNEVDDYPDEEIDRVYSLMHDIDPKFEVREHQVIATKKCMKLRRGIIQIATGGGKTEVMASICHLIKGKILIINSRTKILKQIDERFKRRGIDKKIEYLSANTDYENSEIIISTNSTAYNRIKAGDQKFIEYLKNIDALIYDEAHHVSAFSQFIVALLSDPKYCLGFTGSPFKSANGLCHDDLITKSIFGGVIHYTSMRYLREKGYAAKLSAYYVKYTSKSMPYKTKNCQRVYKWHVSNNKSRNEAILRLCKIINKLDLKVLIMVNLVDHGMQMVEMLNEVGIKSVFFAGGDTMYTIDDIQKDEKGNYIRKPQFGSTEEVKRCLDSGVNFIIGSQVFNEGVDIESFDIGMLLAANKDIISIVQRMGRITRKKYKGLNECVFIDFEDTKHYIVENWTRSRKNQLISEGVPILEEFKDLEDLLIKISDSRKS